MLTNFFANHYFIITLTLLVLTSILNCILIQKLRIAHQKQIITSRQIDETYGKPMRAEDFIEDGKEYELICFFGRRGRWMSLIEDKSNKKIRFCIISNQLRWSTDQENGFKMKNGFVYVAKVTETKIYLATKKNSR